MIFQNEQFCVSKICNIIEYRPWGKKMFSHPACLPTYELYLVAEGEIEVRFNGEVIYVKQGEMLYLPKGVAGNCYTMRVIKDFVLYNIYFDSFDLLPKKPVHISANNGNYEGVYRAAYRAWKSKRKGYYFKCMQYAYAILGQLAIEQTKYTPNTTLDYLAPAEEYIAEHYCDEEFNYDELVKRSGLSYSYFKKIFIDKFGMPPVKYVTKLKIERASELLKTGAFPVSKVGELCGFKNVYYFSNVFKKCTGVSPKNYRLS